MRSPLTEIYQKVQGMITHVRENLSTDEYMLYLAIDKSYDFSETRREQRQVIYSNIVKYSARHSLWSRLWRG